ncbi:MAG: LacI family DNA-binding transcriptional regulator [Capsulimonadaceae bacterium]|nr:LacI family DNA-binding transcriptional regulator [Capsulimonadaceae bacterium]
MPVTIKEIAEVTGLSVPTVGRILGNKGHLHRPEAREQVLEAARKMGYRANSSARSMRTGRQGCFALLLSTLGEASTLQSPLLQGLLDAMAIKDEHLIVFRAPDHELTASDFIPKIIRELMADGLLINYNAAIPSQMETLIEERHIPSVWINSKHETDSVHPDDYAGAFDATTYLLHLGHSRILYVSPIPTEASVPAPHYSVTDRRTGYVAAMRAEGLEPRFSPSTTYSANDRQIATEFDAIMTAPDRPTAMLVNGANILNIALFNAIARGLRVPQDISLVLIDSEPPRHLGLPIPYPITTYEIPFAEMGRTAVDLLREKLRNCGAPVEPARLPLTLREGATCAPPASL